MPTGCVQCQFVAVCTKAKQATFRDIAEVTVMAKVLSCERITQMYFNKRNGNRQKRIADCDAGVCEPAGIKDYEIDTVCCRSLYPVNQLVFCVALEAIKRMAEFLCYIDAVRLDVIKARRTIDIGLTRAQEIQIWAIE